MAAALTTDSLRYAIGRLQAKMDACAAELNELDGALGDGDLGVTLTRAAARLSADAPNLPADLGMALFQCAQDFHPRHRLHLRHPAGHRPDGRRQNRQRPNRFALDGNLPAARRRAQGHVGPRQGPAWR